MKKQELVNLFYYYNKKYFGNTIVKTDIKIMNIKESDNTCYGWYFPTPSQICIPRWVMTKFDRNFIICTLLHEMVHAFFRDKFEDLRAHPLVQDVENHDYEFAKKLYEIYRSEFTGMTLRHNIKSEVWYINGTESDMYGALKYYGIKLK